MESCEASESVAALTSSSVSECDIGPIAARIWRLLRKHGGHATGPARKSRSRKHGRSNRLSVFSGKEVGTSTRLLAQSSARDE